MSGSKFLSKEENKRNRDQGRVLVDPDDFQVIWDRKIKHEKQNSRHLDMDGFVTGGKYADGQDICIGDRVLWSLGKVDAVIKAESGVNEVIILVNPVIDGKYDPSMRPLTRLTDRNIGSVELIERAR